MSSDASRREVLFVTGSRAEYDILFPVIEAAAASDALVPAIAVTGSHLAPQFGLTVREVEADGFPIAGRIENLLASDSAGARVKSAAIQLSGLVDLVQNRMPDFLVVVGDREESITTALTGAYMNVPVVHIAGGDTADDFNVDNAVRHAVTKLAHLHMAASPGSAERIVKLGEEGWRVHHVGAPGLDRLRKEPLLDREELGREMGVALDGPFAILIQHPILPEMDEAGAQMRATLEAMAGLGIPVFISAPNSDAGNQAVREAITDYALRHDQFHAYHNLERRFFVNLMRHASVLAGNSSSGIIEAPFLGLPVVNVGSRQRGREHGGNVTFTGYEVTEISAALKQAVFDEAYRAQVKAAANPYGDGHAGEKIAAVMARETDKARLLSKRNTF